MVFLLPFCLFLLFINFYTQSNYIKHLTENHQTRISMFTSFLQKDIENIEHFLADMIANDGNYQALKYPISQVDSYLQIYALREKFATMMESLDIVTAFLLECPKTDMRSSSFQPDIAYDKQEAIAAYFHEMVSGNEPEMVPQWQLASINSEYYFYKLVGNNGVYTVCVIAVEDISSKEETQNTESFLIFEQDGIPLCYAQELEKYGIRLNTEGDNTIRGNQSDYFMVQGTEEFLGCRILSLETYRPIGSALFFPALIVMTAILVLLLLYTVVLMKQKFLHPLQSMVDGMEQIGEGEAEKVLAIDTDVREYQKIEWTFNRMMKRIGDLRILAYDRLIQMQQTEMQYYQLQIRPHFFLNCLKNLYAMVSMEKYDVMKEMILSLSQYLRSVLADHSEAISLKKELNSVNSYIRLQQISNTLPCTYIEDIAPHLQEIRVPPMSILTFVENCFKHQSSDMSSLRILVKARLFEDEAQTYVNLTIMDNGNGFPPDVLEILNEDSQRLASEHLGIHNVQQRFSLLYHTPCNFLFSNAGGACVDIFIPYSQTSESTQNFSKGER